MLIPPFADFGLIIRTLIKSTILMPVPIFRAKYAQSCPMEAPSSSRQEANDVALSRRKKTVRWKPATKSMARPGLPSLRIPSFGSKTAVPRTWGIGSGTRFLIYTKQQATNHGVIRRSWTVLYGRQPMINSLCPLLLLVPPVLIGEEHRLVKACWEVV